MRAGRFRHILRVEARTGDRDGAGGIAEKWDTVRGLDKVRARIKPRRQGQEDIDRDRQVNVQTHEIEVRNNRPTRKIKSAHRLVNNDTCEVYAVRGIDYSEDRRLILINAQIGEAP